MRRSRPDRPCMLCGKLFPPKRDTTRFCSRQCRHASDRMPPPGLQYAYRGRLSDALWREIHAARAEAATAPLYRPGMSL